MWDGLACGRSRTCRHFVRVDLYIDGAGVGVQETVIDGTEDQTRGVCLLLGRLLWEMKLPAEPCTVYNWIRHVCGVPGAGVLATDCWFSKATSTFSKPTIFESRMACWRLISEMS
jgi:hypothetical protein